MSIKTRFKFSSYLADKDLVCFEFWLTTFKINNLIALKLFLIFDAPIIVSPPLFPGVL